MRARWLAVAIVLTCGVARPTFAQGARLMGTVRDSADHPMPRAEVSVGATGRRGLTDSLGRFSIENIPAGKYSVRARKLGYAPGEWTVDLSNGGRAELHLVLGSRLFLLDTVVVSATRTCSTDHVAGFLCRRGHAKGVFIDYTDIDEMEVLYTADIFRGVEGFHVTTRTGRTGAVRVPVSTHCVTTLVNGHPAGWNSVPEEPYDISAIEIYKSPKDIPREFARYTWGKEQCWMVIYWTVDFAVPLPRARIP